MEILNHPSCTTSIGAPSDMPNPDCSDLPCTIVKDEHGTWTVSYWKPDETELADLNGGGCIALYVRASGRQHPVVGLATRPE